MITSAELLVWIWKVPVVPVTDGLVIALKVKLLAPTEALVPPERVTVTLDPETLGVSVPSKLLGLLTATAPNTNPAGNVTTIFPVLGMVLEVVKDTTALPVTPAVKEAGITDAGASAPEVMVTPATDVF